MRNIASFLTPPISLGTGDPNEGLPGTGKSGPRGIESVIEYNGLYMNIRNWVDTYLVTNIGGLDDADVRDNRDVNPGYHGETAYPSYYSGRSIVLTGKIYSKTIFKMRDMQQGLRQAFAQLDDELPLIFRANDPELDMMIYAKKSQSIQMADEQRTANHFERPFQIMLRAGNPRFLSVAKEFSNRMFTAATYDSIALTILNDGNFQAQPEIQLYGPMSAVQIINETNGDRIALTAPIPSGERWNIMIADRRMYRESDKANRFQYLDVNSDWLELEPGKNQIHFIASGMTSGTSQIIVYHHHTIM
jgi:Siphovirus-type tail component, C-terminal domain